ncbi:trimeric intracellular cation channel family protein [Yeosuana sp. MJ-SS3]|uniref:Trimeric intracellular cation channel family protein n=1 Tax=Gilvirhabdus luticola TaxID=3079858 RepID=A0ABU3U8V6_9FLAO|nr:trimeric intracellular cation channel family protein [Yeosuana sp. MJ-SS3]MDU8886515.1 trimeric intracellular cation channel family protein [Yeosuana sp. MJ-SS3]
MFYFVDILGTIAFAISGVLVAMNKRMDIFGIIIIAFVTAIGGGTLRDVITGQTPVNWMLDITYTYVIIGASIFAIVLKNKINYLRTSLFLFDTIGIGLYTVVGVEKGIALGLHPILCIALGTVTACFGGVIRDMLCNEIPVIFRREIYATACLLGGVSYFVLSNFLGEQFTFVIAGIIVITVRLLAVKFNIALPNIYKI